MTAAADPPIPDDQRRTARHQMILAALTTLLFGLAIVLGSELAATDRARSEPTCTVDTETRDCGPEESCVRGRCKPLPPLLDILPCQEGDACDGRCTCEGAFSCDPGQRCTATPENSCGPEITALLADLQRFERSQCKKIGEDASQCPPKALDQFFISHRQFDAVLLGLRHTTTIHFDSRRSGTDLPGRQQQEYQAQFAALAARLRDAKEVLIIARASQDGRDDLRTQNINYLVAQNRLDAVAGWVVAQEPTPEAQNVMARKLIRLAIGTSHPLRAEILARNREHHYVTWSKRQSDHLRDAINHHQTLDPDPDAAANLHRVLNQSVLLVPIPCELPAEPINAAPRPATTGHRRPLHPPLHHTHRRDRRSAARRAHLERARRPDPTRDPTSPRHDPHTRRPHRTHRPPRAPPGPRGGRVRAHRSPASPAPPHAAEPRRPAQRRSPGLDPAGPRARP